MENNSIVPQYQHIEPRNGFKSSVFKCRAQASMYCIYSRWNTLVMLIETCFIPNVSVSYRGKVSELHFKKTTDAHAGSYTCEAINNLGKTSTVGNVTLLRGKTIHKQCLTLS